MIDGASLVHVGSVPRNYIQRPSLYHFAAQAVETDRDASRIAAYIQTEARRTAPYVVLSSNLNKPVHRF